MAKSFQPWVRRSQRLVRMVSELHRMGYQRLRIMPHEYPLAWRCVIAPASRFSRHNGAFIPKGSYEAPGDEKPWYSSGMEDAYFGWEDAAGSTARELAEKFIIRFPLTSAAGAGRDWRYAGWLSELVGRLEAGDLLPMLWAEDYINPLHEISFMPIRDYGGGHRTLNDFPLPPPGRLKDPKPPPSGQTGPKVTGLASTLTLLGEPNYLGTPDVVSKLVGRVLTTAVTNFRGDCSYAEVIKVNQEVGAALDGSDSTYTLMPGWHSAEELGQHLVKRFGLDPGICGADYSAAVSEALISLHTHVHKILKAYMKDETATSWEGHGMPQLITVQSFARSVFQGLADLEFPGRTLDSFTWQEPSSSSS